MSCPKCGSDDWKLAQLVYKEGLTNFQTNSNGVGVGISGGGVGLGVGGSSTDGSFQTTLSVAASPPVNPAGEVMEFFYYLSFAGGFLYGWLVEDSLILGFLIGVMVAIIGGIVGGFIAFFYYHIMDTKPK